MAVVLAFDQGLIVKEFKPAMQFRGQYQFLSNFYKSPITATMPVNGKPTVITFNNAEAAFQACKDLNRAAEFAHLDGPKAKRLGKRVNLRSDWESLKVSLMRQIIAAKFRQNPRLIKQLVAVDEPIVEENTWGDTFWGVCNGRGENMLGKILEDVKNTQRV